MRSETPSQSRTSSPVLRLSEDKCQRVVQRFDCLIVPVREPLHRMSASVSRSLNKEMGARVSTPRPFIFSCSAFLSVLWLRGLRCPSTFSGRASGPRISCCIASYFSSDRPSAALRSCHSPPSASTSSATGGHPATAMNWPAELPSLTGCPRKIAFTCVFCESLSPRRSATMSARRPGSHHAATATTLLCSCLCRWRGRRCCLVLRHCRAGRDTQSAYKHGRPHHHLPSACHTFLLAFRENAPATNIRRPP